MPQTITTDLLVAGTVQASGVIQSESGGNTAVLNAAGSQPSMQVDNGEWFGTLTLDSDGARFNTNGNLHFVSQSVSFSDAGQWRMGMGVRIGIDVQAYSAQLDKLAALVNVNNRWIKSSGAGYSLAAITSADVSGLTSAATTALGTSGATIPLNNGDNIWSGLNKFSGTVARVYFQETDQGTDLKQWALRAEAGVFRLSTALDNNATSLDVLTFTRDGRADFLSDVYTIAGNNSIKLSPSGSQASVEVANDTHVITLASTSTGGRLSSTGSLALNGTTYTFSNPSAARSGMGVAIGTDVQAYSLILTNLSTTGGTGKVPYSNGFGTATWQDLTPAIITGNWTSAQTCTANGSWAWSVSGVVGYCGATSIPAPGGAVGTSSNHPFYIFTNGAVACTFAASGWATFAQPVAATNFRVGGSQVVGARDNGWTAMSGPVASNKGAHATVTIAAAGASYNQTHIQTLVTEVNKLSARVRALEEMLRTHGLIN